MYKALQSQGMNKCNALSMVIASGFNEIRDFLLKLLSHNDEYLCVNKYKCHSYFRKSGSLENN